MMVIELEIASLNMAALINRLVNTNAEKFGITYCIIALIQIKQTMNIISATTITQLEMNVRRQELK